MRIVTAILGFPLVVLGWTWLALRYAAGLLILVLVATFVYRVVLGAGG
jgi:hypothetical protein